MASKFSAWHGVPLTFAFYCHSAGSLAASMVIGCLFLARYFAANSLELFGEEAWKLALALHIFGWVAQVKSYNG